MKLSERRRIASSATCDSHRKTPEEAVTRDPPVGWESIRAWRARPGVPLALLLLYVGADLGLRHLADSASEVIPWYPGAGLALGFLVCTGWKGAPALFTARLLLYYLPTPASEALWISMFEAASYTAAYLAAAELIRARVLGGLASWRVQHAAWLVGAIGFVALAAGLIGALHAHLVGSLGGGSFWRYVAEIGYADAAGAVVIVPVLLAGLQLWLVPPGAQAPEPPPRPSPGGWGNRGMVYGALVVAALLVGGELLVQQGLATAAARLVLLIPVAVVAAREGMRGAAVVLGAYGLVCTGIAAAPGSAPLVLGLRTAFLMLGPVALLLGAARTEFAESDASYWHLLAAANEGVWRLDSSGRTLYLNARMAAILGRPAKEVIGAEVGDFILPADRPAWEEERRRRAAGEEGAYEVRVRRGDGGVATVLVRASIVRSSSGTPVGAIAVVTDVTELRRAEADSRRAQVLLEAAFRSSRDAMILYRADDELIVDVNDVWSRITGYRREEVLGRSQRELRIWADPEDSKRLARAIREHGAVQEFEVAFNRHLPGDRTERGHALLSAYPATVEGETYFLVTGRDITVERRRTEAERQLRRLEELGRLAGGVAHDFNNLLTVVLAYTQIARTGLARGEPISDEDLAEVELAAERGRDLARRLLAFSRHQAVEPREVELGEAVARAAGMLRSILGTLELGVERSPEPLPILADPAQLDQVLLNLTVNARDAMPHGGRMVVRTERLDVAPGDAGVLVGPDALPGSYAVLSVSDTGVGMDEETRARVFEPFFTTKPAGVGTGLGLAVVFGIMRQARGSVRLVSAPGEGTTVLLYWPLVTDSPRPEALPQPPERGSRAAGPAAGRVLVVEDEAAVRDLIVRVLRHAGYEVHAAATGLEALQRLRALEALGSPPDLVVSDVLMPGMDGRALAERLEETHPSLPLVLLSGHTGTDDARTRLSNVPLPVLGKPFQIEELLDAVARVVGRTGSGTEA